MFSRLPMYQRQGSSAFKKDLTNTLDFAQHLGQPHLRFPSVHVAGTNGKGSTSHMIASVLQAAGYKTGLYTSPHLKDFRERIRVNGEPVSEDDVVDFIEANKAFLEKHQLSFFELTVGMAFDHFAKEGVDIAVIEVGLGGRLDSTNIICPVVSVITNIGLDHTQFLGDTLPQIAAEKAGIIKRGIPVVVGETQAEVAPVFREVARKLEAPLYFADNLMQEAYLTDLKGIYQQRNVRTAVQTISILQQNGYAIAKRDIEFGLSHVVSSTGLKGRWQILRSQPKVICDTAHNKEGLELVMEQLRREKYRHLHLVLGFVKEKDLKEIWPLFPKEASYYFCRPDIPRGLDAAEVQKSAGAFGLHGKTYGSVDLAYRAALENAGASDLIFGGGSTFVVAEFPI